MEGADRSAVGSGARESGSGAGKGRRSSGEGLYLAVDCTPQQVTFDLITMSKDKAREPSASSNPPTLRLGEGDSEIRTSAWAGDDNEGLAKDYPDLPLVENGKTISPERADWKCDATGDVLGDKTGRGTSQSLWVNLSDGFIGGGRKNPDGSGGNNTAIDHYEQLKAQGRHYPLVVKLGTISPEGADIYSYDEDTSVTMPEERLAQLLARLGIDMMSMVKTEKSMHEIDLELNLAHAAAISPDPPPHGRPAATEDKDEDENEDKDEEDDGEGFFSTAVKRLKTAVAGWGPRDEPADEVLARLVQCDATSFRIEDNRSKHGIWVNGAKIASAILRPGDRFVIGLDALFPATMVRSLCFLVADRLPTPSLVDARRGYALPIPAREELASAKAESMLAVWEAVRYVADGYGRLRAAHLMDPVSRREHPEYYQINRTNKTLGRSARWNESLLSLENIRRHIVASNYSAVEDFQADMIQLFENVCKWGGGSSQIYADVEVLRPIFWQAVAAVERGAPFVFDGEAAAERTRREQKLRREHDAALEAGDLQERARRHFKKERYEEGEKALNQAIEVARRVQRRAQDPARLPQEMECSPRRWSAASGTTRRTTKSRGRRFWAGTSCSRSCWREAVGASCRRATSCAESSVHTKCWRTGPLTGHCGAVTVQTTASG
eukprot:COSAG04_NODE_319_length_16893_cov_23.060141_15_plen_667_part_00